MTNADLQSFGDALIIDAFIDNKVHLLLLDSFRDEVLYKFYSRTNKILQIECEIRDINLSKLNMQAELLSQLRK